MSNWVEAADAPSPPDSTVGRACLRAPARALRRVVPATAANLLLIAIAAASAITAASPLLELHPRKHPLGLRSGPRGNPLAGAAFYVDHWQGAASRQAAQWRSTRPVWASMLDVIANQPGTHGFGTWDGANPHSDVSQYLARAASLEPGTAPMISTYRVVNGHCGDYAPPPSELAAYDRWITGFAQGIGSRQAVLFLEMDSLITVGCLSPRSVQVRLRELHDAIAVLSFCPRLVT